MGFLERGRKVLGYNGVLIKKVITEGTAQKSSSNSIFNPE